MYIYLLNSVVRISVMFAKYFEYYTIVLGVGVFLWVRCGLHHRYNYYYYYYYHSHLYTIYCVCVLLTDINLCDNKLLYLRHTSEVKYNLN